MDLESKNFEQAQANASPRGLKNTYFEICGTQALPYPDDTFNVIHAQQALQQCGEPVKAIVEMRRILKPDGILASRGVDMSVN